MFSICTIFDDKRFDIVFFFFLQSASQSGMVYLDLQLMIFFMKVCSTCLVSHWACKSTELLSMHLCRSWYVPWLCGFKASSIDDHTMEGIEGSSLSENRATGEVKAGQV